MRSISQSIPASSGGFSQSDSFTQEQDRLALDDAPLIFIWKSDALGNVKVAEISPEFEKLFGEREILRNTEEGNEWLNWVHGEDKERIQKEWREVLHSKRLGFLKCRAQFPGADGAVRHIYIQALPITNDDGSFRLWTGACFDITQGLESAAALKASEERFRHISTSAPIGIFLADATGETQWINDAMLRLNGRSVDDCLGHGLVEETVHPEDKEGVISHWKSYIANPTSTWKRDLRILRKSGEVIFIHVQASSILEHGKVIGFVGTAEDVTQQRQAEEALRISEARFASIFQSSPLGVSISTLDEGIFLEVNEEYCRLAGYAKEELIGRSAHELNLWADPADRSRILSKLKKGEKIQNLELRGRQKSGRTGDVLMSLDVVNIPGKGPMLITVVSDIREKKRSEEKLRRNEALLAMATRIGRMGAWAIDLPGQALTWSDEVKAIHEVDKSYTPTVKEALEFYVPEHREIISEATHQCINKGIPFELDLQIINAKGRRVWVRAIGEAERGPSGNIERIQGAFQDVSEQKTAVNQNLELAQRLTSTLETITDAFCMLDADWRFTYVNREAERLLQKSRDFLLGRVVWDQFKNFLGASFQEAHLRARRENQVVAFEEYYPPVGHWLEVRVLPADEGLAIYFRDVTERKKQEKLLAALTLLGQRLNTAISPREAAEIIVETADTLFGWEAAVVDHFASDTKKFTAVLCVDTVNGERVYYPTQEFDQAPPLAKRIIENGPELILRQEPLAKNPGHTMFGNTSQASASMMFVPIRQGERGFGMLSIQSYKFNAYTRSDLEVLQALADHCAGALNRIYSETERRAIDKRLQMVAQTTNDAIWDYELASSMLWWSEGFEKLFGFRRDEVAPTIQSWYDLLHPQDKETVLAELQRALREGHQVWSAEYRMLKKDGTYAYVMDRGHIIRDTHGDAVRMIGGVTDITHRKLAEEKLAEQAALLDKAHEAIIVLDLNHQIIYWNKGAERMYGWTAEEALGQHSNELLCRDPSELAKAHALLFAKGEWEGEVNKVAKDGKEIVVDVRWTLVRDPKGAPKSILSINADITEKKMLEAQFLRAQRMESIGTLAGGIAHDLNNILTPIMLAFELLLMKVKGDEERELIQSLQDNAERGADLVQQVLSFARGVKGDRIAVDLVRIIKDIEKVARETFPKSVRFQVAAKCPLWSVVGDSTQLYQALLNLCLNARDAMPDGGQITITLENTIVEESYASMTGDAKPGKYLVCTVADTGTGMPREHLNKIFEPFFTTKEIGKGTGLGLPTTLAIVKSHEGFINLDSKVGKGTVFKIYLPAQAPMAHQGVEQIEPPVLMRGNGELILVVDDEEPIRKIAQKTLENFGYRTVAAANGAEAIRTYMPLRGEIALVLTDMAMPIMDGQALIIALQSLNPSVKIIASSGGGTFISTVENNIGTGIAHFIRKPYVAETLLSAIHEVLSKK
ncbi:MAG: PAS domain S-box protein [Verrucomicrobiales bacterium]